MAAPRAGDLREVVQFRRATLVDNDLGEVEVWADHEAPQRAKKIDASTREQWRASEVGASITARFQVYRNEITGAITPVDRLICRGREYDISGVIELTDDDRFLEITASARTDRA